MKIWNLAVFTSEMRVRSGVENDPIDEESILTMVYQLARPCNTSIGLLVAVSVEAQKGCSGCTVINARDSIQ